MASEVTSSTSTSASSRWLFIAWLLTNLLLLVVAGGLWAWAEYRYVKETRPPEELLLISQWIVYLLPVAALALNFFLLRRLCLWRHVVYTLVSTLLVSGAWWMLFYTVGIQWHLAIGGTLQ